MNRQKFTKYSAEMIILLLIAVMLIAIPLIRNHNGGFIGRESYFIARMAETTPYYDTLSYSGRVSGYNIGTPYLLSLLPTEYWPFFSFGFAYLSVILFWLLLGRFGIENRKVSLLLLVLSPTLLFLTSTLNQLVVPLFLLLLSLLLLNFKNRLMKIIGIPFALLIPLFDFVFAAISFAILIIFLLLGRKDRKYFCCAAIGILLSTLSYFFFTYSRTGWPSMFNPENQFFGLNYALRAIVSDFGGYAGISLFALILSFIGAISIWQKKYSRLDIFFLVFFILFLSFFRIEAIILLSLLVAVFASLGFVYLTKAHWENLTLKWLVLLIIVCGALFSALAYSKELVNGEPNQGTLFAMEFLSSKEDGVVFSDYSRGNWIAYSGKKNVLDQNFLFAPHAKERFADSRTLLYTRDYNEASKLFRKYEIKYIWMDDGLKAKLYSGKEEGLLFLLQYSSNITNIYNQDGVQIWKIEG